MSVFVRFVAWMTAGVYFAIAASGGSSWGAFLGSSWAAFLALLCVKASTAAKDAEIAHERWLREQAENRCVAVEDQREALRAEVEWLTDLTAAQQPAAVDDGENLGAWRDLWLVLRQTGTVAVPLCDIVSVDWSKCQIERTEQQLTGAVQLRAILLDAQQGGEVT